jgi:transposase
MEKKKIRRRLAILRDARRSGNVAGACRRAGISRTIFYRWRRRYAESGEAGLSDRSRRPRHSARRSTDRTAGIVLMLRLTFGWGPPRIRDYLARVHGVRISAPGIWKILRRLAVARRSQIETARKRAPGQRPPAVDPDSDRTLVLSIRREPARTGRRPRRFLFEARDAAAKLSVIQLVDGRDSKAASFVDLALSFFPLRAGAIETEEKPEFTGFFHWHVLSLGLEHVMSKGPFPSGLPDRADVFGSLDPARMRRGMIVADDPLLNCKIAEWADGITRTAGSAGPRNR